MDVERTANEKLRELCANMGVDLEIRKLWPDEYGPGFYFRFYGVLQQTPLLKIEIVGSYYFGIRDGKESEEVDIFPFINDKRVSPCNSEDYIWKSINGLQWNQVDEGYDGRLTIRELLLDGGT